MNGPTLRVEASALIAAAAPAVYRMIADYKDGHPRVLPAKYFRNLKVEKGGYGAGFTQVTFTTDMIVAGGLLGWIQRRVFKSYLDKVYAAELAQLAEVVR